MTSKGKNKLKLEKIVFFETITVPYVVFAQSAAVMFSKTLSENRSINKFEIIVKLKW